MTTKTRNVMWFEDLSRGDVSLVGGKNASLGEMVRELSQVDIKVPPGFATTADACRAYVEFNQLDRVLDRVLGDLENNKVTLAEAGAEIRRAFTAGDWPPDIKHDILTCFAELGARTGSDDLSVAVRSSATAEDLPDASFAGQQETFLNVRGERALLETCRRCFASLFTDRAITYRQLKGFDHSKVALSIGVQKMVRSDIGASGVMFSIDTETGFDKVVLINGAWGLGENVVQGTVNPDEYQVFKPFLEDLELVPILEKRCGEKEQKMIYAGQSGGETKNVPTSKHERQSFVLNDADILVLARQAVTIEQHYGQPMDMEWAKDGENGMLYIVQARPETVQSRIDVHAMKSYRLTASAEPVLSGLSVGSAIAKGAVCLIEDVADIENFVDGAVLVTTTTDPDWVPIMKRAAAIITDHGGRTSHAAIVSRELGIPAIVGTGRATQLLHDNQDITVSCASGEQGEVYAGLLDFEIEEIQLDHIPKTNTKIMLNLANPAAAFRWWRLPSDGVGLARMEFVVNSAVKAHPMALAHFDALENKADKDAIGLLTESYAEKGDYFVETLSRGLSRIAAAVYPKPVIVRMSDFKTNEYAKLLGGAQFEPQEENPMIGLRGASRYYSDMYRDGFALECRAMHHLREVMGFSNVILMVPFCRSPEEADRVLEVMAENGLQRGENGLEIYVMSEIPSNAIRASEFAERFDGFSIGSNELTQLTLGIDRDNEELADLFEESDPAVLWMVETIIDRAHESGIKVGLCGQAPSNDPSYAQFLVNAGIDSISVTPDSFLAVKTQVAEAERALVGKSTSD
ncbi:phosphoenolpyruvate synthase [Pararhizobium sp. IMCC21322]|uniref:phosphoenolpyruvate synthase n=1 Tax=Pararhizobium sp. IMCC21322 TaxID=3067903 RepID=UPI00274242F2|nr:phosphoenolpyruvate synthase [Pararhizobium sp. IMCC21322]